MKIMYFKSFLANPYESNAKSKKKFSGFFLLLIFGVGLVFFSCKTQGKEKEQQNIVENVEELKNAIASAKPGSQIVMADGEWEDVKINFNSTASNSNPIILRAQNPGKVILTGKSKLTFLQSHLKAEGLLFTDGFTSEGNVIEFKSDSCSLENSAIINFNPEDFDKGYYWVFFEGSHNSVTNCFFKGKNNMQPLIGNDQDGARYNSVTYSYFKDIPYSPENGREIFRIWGYGRSEELGDDGSFFTIAYNLFEKAHGEGTEIISFKSNRNIAHHNTIRATKGGIVGRSGNYNTIENNFILGENMNGSTGIRVAGQGHHVVNNYIANVDGDGLILISGEYIEKDLTGNYDPIEREGTPLGRVPMYGHVKNGLFAHNTFVNTNGVDIHIGASYKANWSKSQRILLPENNTIANNLIYKPRGGISFRIPPQDTNSPLDGLVFKDNIFKGNIIYGGKIEMERGQKGIAVAETLELSKNKELLKLQEGNPAINAGIQLEAEIDQDIEGQQRDDIPDVGADEYSSSEIDSRPLTPKDVGPKWSYLKNNEDKKR